MSLLVYGNYAPSYYVREGVVGGTYVLAPTGPELVLSQRDKTYGSPYDPLPFLYTRPSVAMLASLAWRELQIVTYVFLMYRTYKTTICCHASAASIATEGRV